MMLRKYVVEYYSKAGDSWQPFSKHFTYRGAAIRFMTTHGRRPFNKLWRIVKHEKWAAPWHLYLEVKETDQMWREGLHR